MQKKITIITIFMIIISTFFIPFNPVILADQLINVTATPNDNASGATTTYTIVFTTVTSLTVATIPDRIIITFQTGFDASGATVDGATVTQSGSDPTLASTTATVVILNITADEAAGTQSIIMSGIINTQTPGTEYTVSVETQDGDNSYANLDGPTDSDPPFTITTVSASKLVFSSGAAQTLAAGVGSSAIVIQRQDASNTPVSTGAPLITVTLSTGSVGGAFYSDSGDTIVITSIDIAAGVSNTASFYYKDSAVGSPTLTGASAGLASATTTFTISAVSASKLVFSSGAAQTLAAGVGSSAIVIQRQDASSTPVSTGAPLITVTLSTGSVGGAFYSDSGDTIVITSIDIAAGVSNTASFYYKDSAVGSPTLTGASAGLASATTTFTISAVSASKLVFSSGAAQTLAAGVGSSAIVIQRQDASSTPVSTGAPLITVTLSTGSVGGAFYSDSGDTIVITSIDIAAGVSNTASFYYKDSAVGSPTLTGASAGLTSATTTFTISAVEGNLPPIFGSPTPSNGLINNPLNLSWNISINDPEGDVFSWTIQCSNGQTNSRTDEPNGTKSLSLSGLAYSTTYSVWVNATDSAGSNEWTRLWYTFTTEQINNPPNTPSNLHPSNGSTVISVNDDLSWTGGDLDVGDTITYHVYFGTTNPPPQIISNQSEETYNPGTMNYLTIYYWKIVAWDNHGANTTSPTWHFTTKSSGGGGGGGGEEPENKKPIANASAGEPYHGDVNIEITFDGSKSYDPDGNIVKWLWVFGDNTTGTGKIIQHTYYKTETYTVTLTVTDNGGATNTDTTTCLIAHIINHPPANPIITGPQKGKKNTNYTYTALSSDEDNDTIQYTVDWGDTHSISQLSGFLPNGFNFTLNHSWTAAGRYKVTVIVTDNQTTSSSGITVYIDAVQTRGVGYLIDNDGDEIYDAFYSDISHLITTVEKKDNDYLIDGNGDGVWEYIYNEKNGLTSYMPPNTPGFEILCIISALAMVILWKRKSRGSK